MRSESSLPFCARRLRIYAYVALRLAEVEVSKFHARIMRNSIFFRSSYCLVDIGSKNGTYLNDARLGEGAETPASDVVRFVLSI